MKKLQVTFALILLSSLLLSCTKQSPQTPSNKDRSVDKSTVSLLYINQKLAIKEDSQLKKFALQRDKAFKKSEIGFWYKKDLLGNGSKLKDSISCKFSYKLLSLKGKILQSESKKIVIGKKQVIVGLEEGLKLLNKGDSATLIIPWYLAYGMKGNGSMIPPYTSILCMIKVYN